MTVHTSRQRHTASAALLTVVLLGMSCGTRVAATITTTATTLTTTAATATATTTTATSTSSMTATASAPIAAPIASPATLAATAPPAATATSATTASTSASSTSASSTSATTAGSVPVSAAGSSQVEEITNNWERFFLPSTSITDRIALLENGGSLQTAIEQRAKDPLQQQASATVKHVELTDPDHATVTYDVLLNGTVALADAQGTAVQQDGVWKVGAQSFCALITLGATAPIPGCS